MKKTLFFIFLAVAFKSTSQIILNPEGRAFQNIPFFNAAFIKEAGITQLKGKVFTKRPHDIIRETKGVLQYQFDSNGNHIKTQWYKPYLNHKDSINFQFSFDSIGNCIQIQNHGEMGRLICKFQFQGDILLNKKQFIPIHDSTHLLISTENYQTSRKDTSEKILCKNQYDMVFSEITKTWNSYGYLLTKVTIGVMSKDQIVEEFHYNLNGLLCDHSVYYNNDNEARNQYCYSYDILGNLLEIIEFKNGNPIYETQIIYNVQNQIPSSIIFYDRSKEFMEIVRFN